MFSGRRGLARASAIETMHAILQQDRPEIAAGRHLAMLERSARRCLDKNPAERFPSASDVAFALQAMSAPALRHRGARGGAGAAHAVAVAARATRACAARSVRHHNPNAEAPQPLGVSQAHLLAISSQGELALINNARPLDQISTNGVSWNRMTSWLQGLERLRVVGLWPGRIFGESRLQGPIRPVPLTQEARSSRLSS